MLIDQVITIGYGDKIFFSIVVVFPFLLAPVVESNV